jgi:hypothetical protein
MTVARSTVASGSQSVNQPASRRYGIPSWLFFSLIVLVSLAFFASQLVINSVRSGVLTTEALDQMVYPGVYWLLASTSIASLVASGILLGLTLSMLVVRGLMHFKPCSAYWVVLAIQVLPWVYFFAA